MSWINDLADALGFGNNKQTDAAQQTYVDVYVHIDLQRHAFEQTRVMEHVNSL